MKLKEAELYVAGYRRGKSVDRILLKAKEVASADPILCERLREQGEWDEHWIELLQRVELPQRFEERCEEESRSKRRLRSQMLHPAMLSVIAGMLVIAGFLGWTLLDRSQDFGGKEAVEQLVGLALEMNGSELQPTQLLVGELGDALYMRGFEGYRTLPSLGGLRAVGSRVLRIRGVPVAQVAVDAHDSLLYVFRASDLGVQLPASGVWRIMRVEGLTAAVREEGGMCTVVSFRGGQAEMEQFLNTFK
jgi:hypothetical protein